MLPVDVIDHILSFLKWDRAALTSCSAAHPFLSRTAERHLYAHITIEGQHRPCSEPYTLDQFQFYKILRDNPRIGKYVRSLRIEVNGLVPFHDKSSRQHRQPLHIILASLPLLERIGLACPVDVVQAVWIHFPEKFRKAFLDCLLLPTMKELSLSDITGFPLTDFDHSPTLKKLSLRGGMIFDTPDPSSNCPSFDTLSLFCTLPSPNLVSWAKTQSMRSLKIGGPSADLRNELPLVLQVWGSSLAILDLDLGYDFRSEFNLTSKTVTPDHSEIALPKLLVLEHITLRSAISLHHQIHNDGVVLRFYKAAFPAIVSLAFGLTSPSLKRITLYFHLSFNGPFSFSDVDWSPLDTLSQLGILLELRISANRTTFHIPPVDILRSLRKVDSLSKLVEQRALVVRGEEQHTHEVWLIQ